MNEKNYLDCDPGMDDSMAIVMACKSPELRVLAVTTTHGNYPIEVTSTNARKMLELLGQTNIPVAKGAGRPLVRKSPSDPFSHGDDGQAGANLPAPKMALSEKTAAALIAEIVQQNPGEVTLVITGPMTNLALALLQYPQIAGQIAEVIAISGMFGLNNYAFANATGDTPQSEWNVYVDPDAAKIVYESGVKLTALGLDVATLFDCDFLQEQIQQLAASNRKEAAFLHGAIEFVRGRGYGAYCTVIDCLAIAYAIDPTLVETFAGRVGIETKEGLTLGMTVLDRRHHHVWENLPLVNIGLRANYSRFLDMLLKCVLA